MTEIIPIFPDSVADLTSETKCGFCTNSKCCTYITQSIDTPRSKADFDLLLWQISHQNIQIYQDTDGWYLLVNNSCTHLQEDGGCGIYHVRPQICRDHTNDFCEYDAPATEGFKRYFENYDSLLSYCKKRFKRWGQ
ncbi:MAG TPA: zinc/iron-chelating domain-containing protein [Gammaproteobacteria bacterium]|nr:zinc/iron-chelating domain-containing protein [Gammaproteobacteria bacterium]